MQVYFVLLLKVGLVCGWGITPTSFYTNTFIIKLRKRGDIPEVLRLLPDLKLKKKIIPRLYEFYKDPEDGVTNNSTYLSYLQQRLKDKVEYVEQAQRYVSSVGSNGQLKHATQANGHTPNMVKTNDFTSLQAPYYGMGIPKAWEKGHKGRNIVIGITDVGVVTDIPDFRDKIDFNLSKSFVIDNWGLEPTDFPFYSEDVFRDHGNNCAGLIIGILNNSVCTVGVAHEAKIAVLKIFSFVMGQMVINEARIAEAIAHELDRIHIFSNSWSTEIDQHFQILPQFMTDVIKHGILKGRHGKGRIQVFPPGGLAGGFSNSPYTITVNAVGTGGRNTEFSLECACVLTTAYGEGHTNSSNEFVTASSNQGNCTNTFKGTSPATAIIAGVIALLLQDNDHLTWREVQYLIIQSSSRDGIQDTKGFVKNAAGRFYHGSYGYGLINAAQLVSEAKHIHKFPKQIVYTSQYHDFIAQWNTTNESIWKLHITCPCDTKRKNCMESVEQVLVKTSFTTHLENETELIVISPSQTKSYLMRSGQTHATASKRENAELLSVHFWGERAVGNWSLYLRKTTNTKGTVSIQRFGITLYGPTGGIPGNIDDQCKNMHSAENQEHVQPPSNWKFAMAVMIGMLVLVFALIVCCVVCQKSERIQVADSTHQQEPLNDVDTEN